MASSMKEVLLSVEDAEAGGTVWGRFMGRTGRAVRHGGFQERKGLEGENVG